MRILLVVFMLYWTVTACCGQSLIFTAPDRNTLVEGERYPIRWTQSGLRSVSIIAHGPRTALGGRSRGNFSIVVSEPVPASRRQVMWSVPWVDAIRFSVKLKGYDSRGRLVRVADREYGFRPRALATRLEDGIYLDLHRRTNQRLYVQRDRRITRGYLSSSSENWEWKARNSHPRRMHDHAGVFRVLSKTRNHWSTLFQVDMPYAMRYHGGHFIHATSPNLYDNLGEPASAGCNRLTLEDARELYSMTPVGFRVVVIGPEGVPE